MDMKATRSPLSHLPFETIKTFLRKVPRSFYIAFIGVFSLGFFTNFIAYSNTFFIGDSLPISFIDVPNTIIHATYSGTRWLANLMMSLTRGLQMPWVLAVLSYLFVSLSVYLLYEIFAIKKLGSMLIICGLMVTFPTFITMHAYWMSGPTYSIALLFSTLPAYLLAKSKNKIWGFFLSCLALVLMLSAYQAFISFAAGLLILVIIRQLLDNEFTFFRFVGTSCFFVLVLICGVVLYLALGKILSFVGDAASWNITRGIEASTITGRTLGENFVLVFTTIKSVLLYFLKPGAIRHIPMALSVVHWLSLVAGGVIFVYQLYRSGAYKKWFVYPVLLLLILSFFFAINVFDFFGTMTVHMLMRFSYVLPYIFLVFLLDRISGVKISLKIPSITVLSAWILIVAFGTILIYNWTLANAAHLSMKTSYDRGLALANRIAYGIESTPGYTKETPIAFIGYISHEEFPDVRHGFEDLGLMAGAGAHYSPCNIGSVQIIMQEQLGMSLNIVSGEEHLRLESDSRLMDMPNFPEPGYIQFLDDILIVHLNNTPVYTSFKNVGYFPHLFEETA